MTDISLWRDSQCTSFWKVHSSEVFSNSFGIPEGQFLEHLSVTSRLLHAQSVQSSHFSSAPRALLAATRNSSKIIPSLLTKTLKSCSVCEQTIDFLGWRFSSSSPYGSDIYMVNSRVKRESKILFMSQKDGLEQESGSAYLISTWHNVKLLIFEEFFMHKLFF